MIVFLYGLIFSFLISFIIFIVTLSYVEVDVKRFKYDSNYKKIEDYLIYMRFKFLNKITWMKLEYKKSKKHKVFNHKMINKVIDFKDVLRIKYLKYLDPKVQRINLEVKISAIDALITSIGVGITYALLSMILGNVIENYNKENCKYLITPIYSEKPQIIINLRCIFNVKMVHIMNIVYILFKRSGKKYERTPNRRSNAYHNG